MKPFVRLPITIALAATWLVAATAQPAAAAALNLTIVLQPASSFPSVPFGTQPIIAFSSPTSPGVYGNRLSAQLTDLNGNLTFNTGFAQLSMGGPCPNNKCTVPVAPNSTTQAFSGLSIDKAGTYRLVFNLDAPGDDTAGGLVLSGPFTVSTGAPSQLRVRTAIAGSAHGRTIPGQLTVELIDAGGNVLAGNSTDTISLQLLDAATLGPPVSGAVLGGPTSATLSRGIATFTGLTINRNGDYILRASAPGLPSIDIRGPKYTVSPGALDNPIFIRDRQLTITSGPSSGKVGQPLDALVVQLTDSGGVLQGTNENIVVHLVANGYDRPFTYAGSTVNELTVPLGFGSATISGAVIPATTGPETYSFVVEAAGANSMNTRAQAGNLGNTAPAAGAPVSVSDRQLVFLAQPGKADVSKPLDQNPVVGLEDATGILIPDYIDTVTVALAPPTTARVAGLGCAPDGKSCTLTLANGGAVFSSFSVDTPGPYTLTATTSALDGAGKPIAAGTSNTFTITGTAPAVGLTPIPAAAPTPAAGPAPNETQVPTAGAPPLAPAGPTLIASLVPPPNTNLATIRASIGALADIPTANVDFDYFGPSRVVTQLIRPPLVSMPLTVGCYSGPNATFEEQSASVIFGIKPAGSQFVIFFIRGTRGYSFDVAVGNYCWIDLF